MNWMFTIAETRRLRLQILVTKFGSMADLNAALSWTRTDPKLSQIRNENLRGASGKPYNMGDSMARKIEGKLQLEKGWMDTPPTWVEQYGTDHVHSKIAHLVQDMPADKLWTAYDILSALSKRAHESPKPEPEPALPDLPTQTPPSRKRAPIEPFLPHSAAPKPHKKSA